METQHGGYLVDRSIKVRSKFPKIVLSIWGSDLYWFQRFPRHQSRIRSILTKVDLLVMECRRDQELAQNLGYCGKFHQVMPCCVSIMCMTSGLNRLMSRDKSFSLKKLEQIKSAIPRGSAPNVINFDIPNRADPFLSRRSLINE